MNIEELIKELRKEQKERAEELLNRSLVESRKEALEIAGKMEVCILNMGPVGEVCRKKVMVDGWGHTQEKIILYVE